MDGYLIEERRRWPVIIAMVLRPRDLCGTITIVPVLKAVPILDLKHSSDGAHAIWASRVIQTLRVRGGMSRDRGHALLEWSV